MEIKPGAHLQQRREVPEHCPPPSFGEVLFEHKGNLVQVESLGIRMPRLWAKAESGIWAAQAVGKARVWGV
eukprot:1578587-Prymnesium_polylepis.1